MYLMSTALEEKFQSFGELLSFLDGAPREKIKRVWVVSSYYDRESIQQLIDYIKSRLSKNQKPELFIVIGAINRGELEALQKMKFGKMFKEGSGIRVTKYGWLFHSKGYLVETTRSGMCAIGSMNLTQAGLNKNEEILTWFRFKHSEAPAFVASFKEYVEDWRLDDWSKEIGAISEGEQGIRWLDQNHPRDKSTQEHEEFVQENESMHENEFVQGDDSNGWLPPEFPDIADESDVQRYLGEEGFGFFELNDPKFVNEREFTLALYKLLFEECSKNSDEYEHDGVTFRYSGAGWRWDVKHYQASWIEIDDNNKQQCAAYSAHFAVTSARLPNQTYRCSVWIYLDSRTKAGGLTSFLNVRVEGKQKKHVDDLQLWVSKPDWKNIWNDEDQYWKIYHDGLMGARINGERITKEMVLREVKSKLGRDRWIEKPTWSKAEQVYLDKLYEAEEVTWENSKEFLSRLLHYAIIRANIRFSRDK